MNKKLIENMALCVTNDDVFADLYDKGSLKFACAKNFNYSASSGNCSYIWNNLV